MLRIGQVESTATSGGQYTDGNVAGGIAATRLRAAAFNAIQEELAHIVESAGITLSPDDSTQVLAALQKHFQANDAMLTALADLAGGANKLPYFTGDDAASQTDLTKVGRDIIGKATVAAVLEYLGLGEAAKLPAAALVVNSLTLTAKIPAVMAGEQKELIIHASQVTSTGSSGVITFPSAFQSACVAVLAHDLAATPNDLSNVRFDVPTNSSAEWHCQYTNSGTAAIPARWCWVAIGW
ncbi:hypothetical protein ACNJKD_09925 [Edwardsiella tarda]|uniref:gp53-like domain-containing protein n=1 Tax=Edwardsiella tarda TaxID=636 RepID=UPI003A8C7D6D